MKPRQLKALFDILLEEVERNPDLAERINRVLAVDTPKSSIAVQTCGKQSKLKQIPLGKNRRAAAVLDPVTVVQQGVDELVERLQSLDLEQLKDIVAEHGMDSQRLVMKWKTRDKVIEHIVAMAERRARKGEAFRI